MSRNSQESITLHASCVALGSSGVLITGKSGAGKSALALDLMALGATLVADDKTILSDRITHLHASCPPSIQGRIEARGVGILMADPLSGAIVRLAIDLDEPEIERLPPERYTILLGHEISLLHKPPYPHFAASVIVLLKGGRAI